MHYSEIKKHIIDKYTFGKYSVILYIFILYIFYNYVMREDSSFLFVFFWIAFICVLLVGIISMNLYKCRQLYKFYRDYLDEQNAQFCKIIIEKEDYNIRVGVWNAMVRSAPIPTNAVYYY